MDVMTFIDGIIRGLTIMDCMTLGLPRIIHRGIIQRGITTRGVFLTARIFTIGVMVPLIIERQTVIQTVMSVWQEGIKYLNITDRELKTTIDLQLATLAVSTEVILLRQYAQEIMPAVILVADLVEEGERIEVRGNVIHTLKIM